MSCKYEIFATIAKVFTKVKCQQNVNQKSKLFHVCSYSKTLFIRFNAHIYVFFHLEIYVEQRQHFFLAFELNVLLVSIFDAFMFFLQKYVFIAQIFFIAKVFRAT